MTQITSEMCDQKHQTLEKQLNGIEKKVDSILYVLNGNGHLGLAGKISIIWSVGIFLATAVIATGIKVWLF